MCKTIRLQIAPELRERYPDIRCGGFLATGLQGISADAAIDPAEVREHLVARGLTLDTVTQDPRIGAWRHAIQGSGLKAAKVRGSAEQLVRRYLRGDQIGGPALVQLYCSVSGMAVAPLGGYDTAHLPPGIVELRFAQDGDTFEPLGGNSADMPLTPTVPVYAVGRTILCWMFNVRDAAVTALSGETSDALFVTEAITPEHLDASLDALATLQRMLGRASASVGPIAWSDGGGTLTVQPPQ